MGTGWRSKASAWHTTPSRPTFGDEATGYLLISARKAIRRSAHALALEQLDLGVWLLRSNEVAEGDDREIEFQLARGVALMAARGWGSTEVLAAFERAEELCEKIGDQARLFTALRGRAQYYMLSGKPAAAQELACRWAVRLKDDSDPGSRSRPSTCSGPTISSSARRRQRKTMRNARSASTSPTAIIT